MDVRVKLIQVYPGTFATNRKVCFGGCATTCSLMRAGGCQVSVCWCGQSPSISADPASHHCSPAVNQRCAAIRSWTWASLSPPLQMIPFLIGLTGLLVADKHAFVFSLHSRMTLALLAYDNSSSINPRRATRSFEELPKVLL